MSAASAKKDATIFPPGARRGLCRTLVTGVATIFSFADGDPDAAATATTSTAARFNGQTMKKNVKWRGRGFIAFLAAALLPRHQTRLRGDRLIESRADGESSIVWKLTAVPGNRLVGGQSQSFAIERKR